MSLSINYQLDVSSEASERRTPRAGTGDAQSTFVYSVIATSQNSKSSISDSKAYYEELSKAVKLAIAEVGDRLTEWRDAVGNEEKEKERIVASLALARKAANDESDDDETI